MIGRSNRLGYKGRRGRARGLASVFQLEPETSRDFDEVEWLYDLCFAPGREALSSYRLRDGVDPIWSLCRVARDADGILAGAVRFWPVRIGAAKALLLGPIAVHPTRQGEGLGGMLMTNSLEAARASGWARVLLVGDEPYYSRFGFSRLNGVEMPPPTNPARILGLELKESAWDWISGQVSRIEPTDQNPAAR